MCAKSGPAAANMPKPKRPVDLKYTESHEWVRLQGDVATVGITDHAQEALNDIVFVELPKAGSRFPAGGQFGVVESVKSVSDLFLPLSGEVLEANGSLQDRPETLNQDPYGKGWLVKVKVSDPAEAKRLLSAKAYGALLD